MLRRAVRKGVRLVRDWLKEDEPTLECGAPPFDYEHSNCFFTKAVKERGLRRPYYVWGAVQALNLAKVLGVPRISLIEFGVAGGNGLTALESIAEQLGPVFGIEVETHGFDSGNGVPKTGDPRDLPHMFQEGFYPMDQGRLIGRLKSAKLHIGLIEETAPAFARSNPAPVGMVVFDVCAYTATASALRLFEADMNALLPRVHCFFRSTLALTVGDFNGERLAISEFNQNHDARKISQIHGLQYFLPAGVGRWVDQYYMAHVMDHPQYGTYDGLVRLSALDLKG